MARLIVVAASEDTIAAPFNRQPNYIVVSVTDADGEPVRGLTKRNFKVDPMIVAPGGALVRIIRAVRGRLPGFYHIDVVPIRNYTWKKGVYIFAIAVERSRIRLDIKRKRRIVVKDKGQTLASVMMD